ncbi:MAG TPA: 4a-hydroxytetrahydrobiopterin dehydratase [Chloroflexota bacterium]|nr:4a-hydroxytetrahydrobiopterin dehydratase [Chloroflexota bacterium]
MQASLADQTCVPCKGGVPPLTAAQIAPLLAQLDGWEVERDKKLVRTYRVKNFAEAMALANRVAAIAEEQQHHPDLHVAWGRLGVEVWTHKIDGLTESDFVFAAKCDRAYAADRAAATA